MNTEKISKNLSYVLRHRPDSIGIILDNNGWCDINDLMEKSEIKFTIDELLEVVQTSDKQRFAFNDDRTKIRANQGHSIKIDLDLKEITPPDKLYHGTAERFKESILENGLQKMNRHHVHMYSQENIEKAKDTGKRHQKSNTPLLLTIDSKQMFNDGYKFFKSENNIFLTLEVPPKYII